MSFVLDIPQKIVDYRDAINDVFKQLSSKLSQIHIYKTIDKVNELLLTQIHQVMISFVKVCAHVVKYKQGGTRQQWTTHLRDILKKDDTEFKTEMASFGTATQRLHEVEGTVTLATAIESKEIMVQFKVEFTTFANNVGQKIDDTHKIIQASDKKVKRAIALEKISKNLGLTSAPGADALTSQSYADIKCLKGTGEWILGQDSYKAWASNVGAVSHVLILTGSPASGKTFLSAYVAKQLDKSNSRIYVAHHSFPAKANKFTVDNNPIQAAMKDIAFQIARVDEINVFKALSEGDTCQKVAALLGSDESLETLNKAWKLLNIGSSGANATYYIVLDGIENLLENKSNMLLNFLHGIQPNKLQNRRVRFLVTGPNSRFPANYNLDVSLKIEMWDNNRQDMEAFVRDALDKEDIWAEALNGTEEQQARQQIIERLPENVSGNYSLLKSELKRVSGRLADRLSIEELDSLLDPKFSGRKSAIQEMQRTLKRRDIDEVKEILKWVIFGGEWFTLEELESALVSTHPW